MVSLALVAFSFIPPADKACDDLVSDLRRQVGTELWLELESRVGWAEFFRRLGGHETWLRELLDSGPVKRPRDVLECLHDFWMVDGELHERPVDRSMATAFALTAGDLDKGSETLRPRYEFYRDSYARGLLHASYSGLVTWERRFLARGTQWGGASAVESLVYLRDTITWPRPRYVKACWQAPYRLHNCLGDSVHGADYYLPFQGSFSCLPEMTIKVGGVCGALSNLGASAAMANGIPAATMGEPGHCAYTVKIDGQTWQPAYSLSWKRSLHTKFHSASWPALMLTEACYSDATAVSKSSDLARRAYAEESKEKPDIANGLWAQALKAHPLHFELWLQWAAFGERHAWEVADWRAYHDALLAGLGSFEEAVWSVLSSRVYPKLLDGQSPVDQRALILEWIATLSQWGGGRWNVEGALDWLIKRFEPTEQIDLVREMGQQLLTSPDFASPYVSWLLTRYQPDSPEWGDVLADVLQASSSQGGEASLRQLARKALPDAAERGDVETFQVIGKAASRLSEPKSMEGLNPFEGELLSAGGLLQVSGRGNRWDSPEHHWGVLGEHGGACHTNTGASFIAVQLEHHALLTGIVIQNRAGGFQWRAGGSRIEISSDGTEWKSVGVLEGSKGIYRLDLRGKEHECRWVRMIKDTNCLHLQRFLVYGERRS